jgi:hypothetical protein
MCGGSGMKEFYQVEDYTEFRAFFESILPNCLVVITEGEIVIQTGIGYGMGDQVYPLDKEELEEIRG